MWQHLCSAGLAVMLVAPALAHPPSDPDFQWYQSLKQPGTGLGCCSQTDCHPVQYRMAGKHYEAFISRDAFGAFATDTWMLVPDGVVLIRDNPTGEAVACYSVVHGPSVSPIICFIPSNGA